MKRSSSQMPRCGGEAVRSISTIAFFLVVVLGAITTAFPFGTGSTRAQTYNINHRRLLEADKPDYYSSYYKNYGQIRNPSRPTPRHHYDYFSRSHSYDPRRYYNYGMSHYGRPNYQHQSLRSSSPSNNKHYIGYASIPAQNRYKSAFDDFSNDDYMDFLGDAGSSAVDFATPQPTVGVFVTDETPSTLNFEQHDWNCAGRNLEQECNIAKGGQCVWHANAAAPKCFDCSTARNSTTCGTSEHCFWILEEKCVGTMPTATVLGLFDAFFPDSNITHNFEDTTIATSANYKAYIQASSTDELPEKFFKYTSYNRVFYEMARVPAAIPESGYWVRFPLVLDTIYASVDEPSHIRECTFFESWSTCYKELGCFWSDSDSNCAGRNQEVAKDFFIGSHQPVSETEIQLFCGGPNLAFRQVVAGTDEQSMLFSWVPDSPPSPTGPGRYVSRRDPSLRATSYTCEASLSTLKLNDFLFRAATVFPGAEFFFPDANQSDPSQNLATASTRLNHTEFFERNNLEVICPTNTFKFQNQLALQGRHQVNKLTLKWDSHQTRWIPDEVFGADGSHAHWQHVDHDINISRDIWTSVLQEGQNSVTRELLIGVAQHPCGSANEFFQQERIRTTGVTCEETQANIVILDNRIRALSAQLQLIRRPYTVVDNHTIGLMEAISEARCSTFLSHDACTQISAIHSCIWDDTTTACHGCSFQTDRQICREVCAWVIPLGCTACSSLLNAGDCNAAEGCIFSVSDATCVKHEEICKNDECCHNHHKVNQNTTLENHFDPNCPTQITQPALIGCVETTGCRYRFVQCNPLGGEICCQQNPQRSPSALIGFDPNCPSTAEQARTADANAIVGCIGLTRCRSPPLVL